MLRSGQGLPEEAQKFAQTHFPLRRQVALADGSTYNPRSTANDQSRHNRNRLLHATSPHLPSDYAEPPPVHDVDMCIGHDASFCPGLCTCCSASLCGLSVVAVAAHVTSCMHSREGSSAAPISVDRSSSSGTSSASSSPKALRFESPPGLDASDASACSVFLAGEPLKNFLKKELKRKYSDRSSDEKSKKFTAFKTRARDLSTNALHPDGDGPLARNIAAAAFLHFHAQNAEACAHSIMGPAVTDVFSQDAGDDDW